MNQTAAAIFVASLIAITTFMVGGTSAEQGGVGRYQIVGASTTSSFAGFRIDTVTGEVSFCDARGCRVTLDSIDPED